MIGVIVEGIGEISAIQCLLTKVSKPNNLICRPLRADLQPKANYLVIARSAKTAIKQLVNRGAQKVVILIDREDHPCTITFASELTAVLGKMYGCCAFSVVIKNHSIENWLISDLNALINMPARFTISSAIQNSVTNGADEIKNPVGLLNGCAIRNEYHKGQDPAKIASHMELDIAAKNSRSFRKFLREIGHSTYANQSKLAI